MKDRKDDLDSRKAGFMVDAYGDTAAVIDDRDAVSLVDDDLYFRTETGQSLIHRIVHDLIYQMMESPYGSASDVHSRSFADCLQTLQDLDLVCAIFCILLFCTHFLTSLSYYSIAYPKYFIYLKTVLDKLIESRTGDQCLYIMNAVQKIFLPAAVKLREHVVQKKHRRILDFLLHQLDLGKLQRKRCRTLLPLGTEFPDIHTADIEAEIIPVGSRLGRTELQIPVPVGRKPCFKLFRLHIFLIMDHQSLPSSGKALMDSAYDLV